MALGPCYWPQRDEPGEGPASVLTSPVTFGGCSFLLSHSFLTFQKWRSPYCLPLGTAPRLSAVGVAAELLLQREHKVDGACSCERGEAASCSSLLSSWNFHSLMDTASHAVWSHCCSALSGRGWTPLYRIQGGSLN